MSSTASLLWNELLRWYASFVKSLPNLLVACVVVALFYFLAKLISRGTRRLLDRAGGNTAIHDLLARMVMIFWLCMGVFIALGVLDLQKTVMSLLAGAGVLGLVLGIAFQDIAANFFAGILISLRKPYELGDEIVVGTHTGAVVAINLRNTIIKDFDGSQVLIPNRKIVEDKVINRTRYGTYRITVEVGISFNDDPRKLKALLIPEIQKIEGVLAKPPVTIDFTTFGQNALLFNVRAWITYTKTSTASNSMRDEIVIRIKEVLDKNGFIIPTPINGLASIMKHDSPTK